MDDKQKIDILIKALTFYTNSDIYWFDPIPLELNCDMRTLKIANRHHDAAPILQDWGRVAVAALVEIGAREEDDEHVYRGPNRRSIPED